MKIQPFNPVLYPQKLWIAVSRHGTGLNGLFRHKNTGKIMYFEEYGITNSEAVTFPVSEVETGDCGVLIVFTKRKHMNCKTIAHEAVHAAGYMFQYIGQEVDGEEPFAYLAGWVADCCRKVNTNV
jgi:hypothetical protein